MWQRQRTDSKQTGKGSGGSKVAGNSKSQVTKQHDDTNAGGIMDRMEPSLGATDSETEAGEELTSPKPKPKPKAKQDVHKRCSGLATRHVSKVVKN